MKQGQSAPVKGDDIPDSSPEGDGFAPENCFPSLGIRTQEDAHPRDQIWFRGFKV